MSTKFLCQINHQALLRCNMQSSIIVHYWKSYLCAMFKTLFLCNIQYPTSVQYSKPYFCAIFKTLLLCNIQSPTSVQYSKYVQQNFGAAWMQNSLHFHPCHEIWFTSRASIMLPQCCMHCPLLCLIVGRVPRWFAFLIATPDYYFYMNIYIN